MKEETEADVSRRKFFVKAGLGLGALAAVAVAIPVVGALIGPLLQKKNRGLAYPWQAIRL